MPSDLVHTLPDSSHHGGIPVTPNAPSGCAPLHDTTTQARSRYRVWLTGTSYAQDVFAPDAAAAHAAAEAAPQSGLRWYRPVDVPMDVCMHGAHAHQQRIVQQLSESDPCEGCGLAGATDHERTEADGLVWVACAQCGVPVCSCHCASVCDNPGCSMRCCPLHTKERDLEDPRSLCFVHALAAGYTYDAGNAMFYQSRTR